MMAMLIEQILGRFINETITLSRRYKAADSFIK